MEGVKRVFRPASVLFLLAAVVVCGSAPRADAASTTVQWDQNTEPYLAGYKVYYGLASQTYTTHIDVGKVVSHVVTNLAASTKYYFAATAYDSYGNESGYSNETTYTTPAAAGETISTPLRPSGPATGVTGVAYTYTASGAVSSTSDPVQYRFSWSDGSDSNWLAAGVTSASKSWSAPGTYALVLVEARCASHTSVVSSSSPALTVSIAAAPQETVSAPSVPSGPTSGVVGGAYTYTTGGAVSSDGHSVEYRFSWSDGSVSAWLPAVASASKTWNSPGTYTLVKAEARCALHPSILSATSLPITVTISSGVVESVSQPSTPAGPAGGEANGTYVFSTGGSVSSSGDPVVYRFHWGDGTSSEWVGPGQPVTAGKSWSVPGTYLVQAEAACATHPTVGFFSQAVEVSIVESQAAPASYVLWTRSDSGKASLWKIDPSLAAGSPPVIPVTSSSYLYSSTGVGKGWQATSFQSVGPNESYVLWTRSDTGMASLWKVDPSLAAGSPPVIPVTSSSYLYSATGVGAGWQATCYQHVGPTEGYVLWTQSTTGKATLWKVDPSLAAGSPSVIPVTSSSYLYSATGVGAGWVASSYQHVGPTEGYVLWTQSKTGKATLWKIDPSLAAGSPSVIPLTTSSYLYSTTGVGAKWQASSYQHVGPGEGYVLWTRSDNGKASLWKINPSQATGTSTVIPLTSSAYLYSATGVGAGWQATGFAR